LKAGGGLGDKYNLKYYLAFGMMPAALVLFAVAFLGIMKYFDLIVFGVLMAVNGIF